MGADFVGFINCELQRPLGPAGFLRQLKLRAYRASIDSQVPADQRQALTLQIRGANNIPETLTYPAILAQLGGFEEGCASCKTCPVGLGEALGCYRFVHYPVDARFEEALFGFFVEELKTKDSIGDQIYRDIVSQQGLETVWHDRGASGLAERAEPLTHTDGRLFSKPLFDSAQLLAALFLPTHAFATLPPEGRLAVVVGYRRLLSELVAFARKRLQPGLSRTLDEVEALAPLYLGAIAAQAAGGQLIIDS